MQVDWATFRDIVNSKALNIQYIEKVDCYLLEAYDGPMRFSSEIVKDQHTITADVADFENNYKAGANKNLAKKTRIKMCKFKATTDGTGVATILLPIPQTTRVLRGGVGWFATPHPDDYITADIVALADANQVIKTMYEDEVNAANEGWYFPSGYLQIHPIDETMELPYGVQLRLKVYKGDGSVDTVRGNIEWGQP